MAKSAAELCDYHRIPLKPEGKRLLDAGLTPRRYFDRLRESGCFADARRFLAHVLARRRALWWGCWCLRDVYPEEFPPTVADAVHAVLRYILNPDESQRRLTGELGMALGFNTVEGCLAMSAYCSGGSLSLPGLPFVAPKPFTTGRLVGAVVYIASVRKDPARYKDHLDRYLSEGLRLAQGADPWLAPNALFVDPAAVPGPRPFDPKRRAERMVPADHPALKAWFGQEQVEFVDKAGAQP